jgi:hypothetical protein
MTERTYTGPERRLSPRSREWRDQVNQRLNDGSLQMKAMHTELQANTAATLQVQADTAELVSLLNSFKGAFKVFDLVGKAAKPLSYIAMAVSALWGLFTVVKGGGGR